MADVINVPNEPGSPLISLAWYTDNPNAERFEISTAEELAGLAELVNRRDDSRVDFKGKTIVLINDIDLSERHGRGYNGGKGWVPIGELYLLERDHYKDNDDLQLYERAYDGGNGWIPIGYDRWAFKGIFDGNGKTISGLYINCDLDFVGLFGGIADDAEIKNLGVKDIDVTGGNWVGGVVGATIDSEVTDCYSIGVVNGKDNVGGIIGYAIGGFTTENSYFKGTVNGDDKVGGIAGAAETRNIHNCYSTGAVNGNGSVGGIAGFVVTDGNIDRCYSTGAISGIGGVGGVAGAIDEGCGIGCSYSTGMVSGRGNVGGVAGYIEWGSGVGGCYSTGAVSGSSDGRAAGVVGMADDSNVVGCAALNPSVMGDAKRIVSSFIDEHPHEDGFGGIDISKNIAFSGMIIKKSQDELYGSKIEKQLNGTSISAAQIHADGTLGGLFTAKDGWTTQNGKLPGIGAPVDMPEHLRL